ncbi:oxygen tolerance protein BatD [Cereibacter changlensis]|uniref:Oxygen tolerance protein BatD n=2 Tax=Cereibacter changlensis TaxID=402884 RepID=A0A2W7R3Q4_9RHOB|nr:BatD family protein [Cereibacter changlensis]PZX52880.1 oxygen tolerance protein BatD [Cereibacter changlensis]
MVMLRAVLLCLLASPGLAELPAKSLEIIAAPTSPSIVVGEMIPVTLRGVYDKRATREELTLRPSDAFDWLPLAKDSWREERIEGRSVIVVERKLALFAKHAGLSRFGPADHRISFVGEGEQVLSSHPLELTIAPMPEGPPFHSPHGWRFAAGKLTIRDELSTDPAHLADGETVTRRVTLRAEGALPEMLPPRPVVSEPWLITFAAPVQRELELTPEGPVASVIWEWQFRPETGEPGVLPPVPIPYFNTVSRKVEQVEIPALPIGYASFAASQSAGGDLTAGSRWGIVGALAAGLAAGLAALVAGHRTSAAAARGLWRRWSPLPWLRVRRAARAGDLLALRRAAAGLEGDRREGLELLDRAIYAPAAPGLDPRRLLRALRRQRR